MELWLASHSGILAVRSQQRFPSASSQGGLVTELQGWMAAVGTRYLPTNALQLVLHGSLKIVLGTNLEAHMFWGNKREPLEWDKLCPSLDANWEAEAAVPLWASGWYSSTANGLQHTKASLLR